MAYGNTTYQNAGGAVNDLFSGVSTFLSDNLKAEGFKVEGQNYDLAASLAHENAQFTEQSTAVKEMQEQRQIYLGLGTTKADVAGAGFTMSGSALDILRSGAQQGALTKQVIGQQGLITEAGFNEQADSYTALANYARSAASKEGILGGLGLANGIVGSIFKGAAALATL